MLLCLAFLVSCNTPTPQELAMEAAQVYYQGLFDGQYHQFLNGKAGADSLSDSYREQLLVAYKQFVIQQQKKHGGIAAVEALRAMPDSTMMTDDGSTPAMQVFLQLSFGDGGFEEIVVPMVSRRGAWLMK